MNKRNFSDMLSFDFNFKKKKIDDFIYNLAQYESSKECYELGKSNHDETNLFDFWMYEEHLSREGDLNFILDTITSNFWKWITIFSRTDLTYEFLDKFFSKFKKLTDDEKLLIYGQLKPEGFSLALNNNPNINLKIIIKYPYIGIWFSNIYAHPEITPEIIECLINNGVAPLGWCEWKNISKSKYITINFITRYINRQLDWSDLSYNKSISIDDINNTYDDARFKWDWDEVSKRARIKDIDKYPNLPWNFYCLFDCEYDYEIINRHIDKPWNFIKFFSEKIDLKMVKKHPDKIPYLI